ncbi:MAG: SagB/ThcOx family dehydrogenase [Syntrophales bacterium LBB04]|nr:SagB/ThcOx family dehydrogenase [Syntrophales bacterium LBB04]
MEKTVSRREFLKVSATAGVMITAGTVLSGARNAAHAKDAQPIRLSKPQGTSDNVMLKILEKRSSSREFAPEPLPVGVLSNLLWAAFGINRSDGKRTAPSARNRQEIDIYVAAPDGLYLYDPKGNVLKPILAEDIRALTGTQPYVKEAAVNLVYVADLTKMGDMAQDEKMLWMGGDTGVIVENVYLFCAAEGLATVVRALIDRPALAKAMKLRPDQMITLSQSVGYPKKKA